MLQHSAQCGVCPFVLGYGSGSVGTGYPESQASRHTFMQADDPVPALLQCIEPVVKKCAEGRRVAKCGHPLCCMHIILQ